MPDIFFAFVKAHWQTTLMASAVLAVAGSLSLQHLEIGHLRSELASCRARSATLEDSNQLLTASIRDQNAAIDMLRADGRQKQKAAEEAVQEAMRAARKYDEAARRIREARGTKDECADARKLVDDFVKGGM